MLVDQGEDGRAIYDDSFMIGTDLGISLELIMMNMIIFKISV
jgi:hypothetical protein